MSRPIYDHTAQQFLDLEAEVDKEDEEDEATKCMFF
jgi:hypothetical protein